MARTSSRLTSVHVNISQNNSGCEVLQRVYRPAGRSHMLKMFICVHSVCVVLLATRLEQCSPLKSCLSEFYQSRNVLGCVQALLSD